ncbi:MAG: glycerol-3-phosphate dehydrogenase/oxidase [Chloroflexota bacterium]
MKRDVARVADSTYDVIVVGGGIFGICTAWDAALRGLSVALIEQGDFGHATSASHFKVVHGGIRYLQHADFPRIRESSLERTALLKVAPHLVFPMPFVIPTYGHGLKGKELMQAALAVYDLCTVDRNRPIHDPSRQIPRSQILNRSQVLELFPYLATEGLSGAALFHDGQMVNPPRLSLAFVHSLIRAGGDAINYAEVIQLLQEGNRITGVAVHDRLSGDEFEVQAKMVINATGPWTKWLLQERGELSLKRKPIFSRDAYFILNRDIVETHALAIQGGTRDPDALLSRGNRHLFLVPWRGYTLVGVWHQVFEGRPESFTLTKAEIQAFIDEVNMGNLNLKISIDDVSMWNAGLTLFGENEPGATHLSYGKRSLLIDHQKEHNIDGLISLVGVRFTTARGMAEKTIDLVLDKLGIKKKPSTTHDTSLVGGDFDSFDTILGEVEAEVQRIAPQAVEQAVADMTGRSKVVKSLAHHHGTAFKNVLALAQSEPHLANCIGDSSVLAAEVVYAIRNEMACRLADVVFRRTDLGTGAYPGQASIRSCAELMATELRWTPQRQEQELEDVLARFPQWLDRDKKKE